VEVEVEVEVDDWAVAEWHRYMRKRDRWRKDCGSMVTMILGLEIDVLRKRAT